MSGKRTRPITTMKKVTGSPSPLRGLLSFLSIQDSRAPSASSVQALGGTLAPLCGETRRLLCSLEGYGNRCSLDYRNPCSLSW
jgi:hypothetical protein